jgi:4-hydroxybenzoate polyprenyltransferase
MMLFLIGTVLMRSAGCVINDIADMNIDKHVARTQLRPLTSGELSLCEALTLLALLLSSALLILLCLPKACYFWAVAAVFISFLYPFCKRFINTPQMILGLAFSMGIPMAYVASGVPFNKTMILLCLINYLWIIAYDTMYAMVDRVDDLKIGVKSTAIYFAPYDRVIVSLLLITMHLLWVIFNTGWFFYFLWFIAGCILIYQDKLIKNRIPRQCFRSFMISSYYGMLMWLALMKT